VIWLAGKAKDLSASAASQADLVASEDTYDLMAVDGFEGIEIVSASRVFDRFLSSSLVSSCSQI
jgi:hypothetical protein